MTVSRGHAKLPSAACAVVEEEPVAACRTDQGIKSGWERVAEGEARNRILPAPVLLLAIAVPVAWAAEQGMQWESQRIYDHMMILSEPIESWER